MSVALFCPRCQQTVPSESEPNGPGNCPYCQSPLSVAGKEPLAPDWILPPRVVETPPQPIGGMQSTPPQQAGQTWWVNAANGHSTPPEVPPSPPSPAPKSEVEAPREQVPPLPRIEAEAPPPLLPPPPPKSEGEGHSTQTPPVPIPPKSELGTNPAQLPASPDSEISAEPGVPLSELAVALGVAGFGLTFLPHLGFLGLVLASLGLLLALVDLLVRGWRQEGGQAFPFTAGVVCLQALILAAVLNAGLLSRSQNGQVDPDPIGSGSQRPIGPTPQQLEPIQILLEQARNGNPNALDKLGKLASEMVLTRPLLVEALSHADPGSRKMAAMALGNLGPQARPAYPILLDHAKNDTDEAVRQEASAALKKTGPPTVTDVPDLVKDLRLKSPSPNYRAAIAETLGKLGPKANEATADLREALKDVNPQVRLYAAQSLSKVTGQVEEEIVSVLCGVLRTSKDAALRRGAAYALGELGAEARDAESSVSQALKDDDDLTVRLYSAQYLWKLKRTDSTQKVLPVLREALLSENISQQATALEVMALMGKEAKQLVSLVVHQLEHKDPDIRGRAAFALGKMGDDGAPAVASLAKMARSEENTNLRGLALFALQGIGPAAIKAVPTLVDLLEDKYPIVRGWSAMALMAIGRKAEGVAAPALIKALEAKVNEGQPTVQLFLAQALWSIAENAQATLPVLCDILTDRKNPSSVRAAAATALTGIGASAKAAFPALRAVDAEEDELLRQAVQRALDKISKPTRADVDKLTDALQSPNLRYRTFAVQALGMIGPDAKGAVNSLCKAYKEMSNALDIAIVETLGEIGPAAAVQGLPLLKQAFQSSHPELRMAALKAMRSMGKDASGAATDLINVLKTEKGRAETDKKLMIVLIDALVDMGQVKPALQPLISLLQEKNDSEDVLAQAAYAVGTLGKEGQPAVKALTDRLNDPHAIVQIFAARALFQIAAEKTKTVEVLKGLLNNADADIRAETAEALKDMGSAAQDAVKHLRERHNEEKNERVRESIQKALQSIDPNGPNSK